MWRRTSESKRFLFPALQPAPPPPFRVPPGPKLLSTTSQLEHHNPIHDVGPLPPTAIPLNPSTKSQVPRPKTTFNRIAPTRQPRSQPGDGRSLLDNSRFPLPNGQPTSLQRGTVPFSSDENRDSPHRSVVGNPHSAPCGYPGNITGSSPLLRPSFVPTVSHDPRNAVYLANASRVGRGDCVPLVTCQSGPQTLRGMFPPHCRPCWRHRRTGVPSDPQCLWTAGNQFPTALNVLPQKTLRQEKPIVGVPPLRVER